MTRTDTTPLTILLADDDPEDRELARDALAESLVASDLRTVDDGEQLLDYLHRLGNYADPSASPRPGLILLDVSMPRLDGHDALAAIKADASLRQIPVVMLSTSLADEDIDRSYQLGANSYVAKPASFTALVDTMRTLGRYWGEMVELPS